MAFGRPGVENGKMIDGRTDLIDRLRAVPDALATAARAASPEPPAPGEWTPSEVVRHLIAVEQEVWQPRLAQLEAEDHPTWPWTEPDPWAGNPGATLDELLATYAAVRGRTMAMLDALDDAGWARTGTHATFGVLDVAGLMVRAIDHDDEHLRSFER
jgi:DinB family protein